MRLIWPALLLIGCAPDAPRRIVEPRVDDRPAPRGDALLRDTMLDLHNAARREAGVEPLAWSGRLADDARGYAELLARTGTFQHSHEPRGTTAEGENLYTGTRGAYRYDEMVLAWIDEKRFYRAAPVPAFSTTGHWQDVGHYTQIVWRGTTALGCGLASNERDDYLVCRYAPPGNVWGQRAF